MSNRLEDFVENNREQFDDYEPGTNLWKSIEKTLPGKAKKTGGLVTMSWKKWSAVAAIFLAMAGTAYFFSPGMQDTKIQVAKENPDVPPEYAQEVNQFTRLIELKHEELNRIRKDQPELYRRFSGDINKLDSSYQALKKSLPDNPNQEMLLQAMIGNLKWQIDLLNQQLNIIQKIKQSKNKTDEKTYQSS